MNGATIRIPIGCNHRPTDRSTATTPNIDRLNNTSPRKLAVELRGFFNAAKSAERSQAYVTLMRDVSPALKQKVFCRLPDGKELGGDLGGGGSGGSDGGSISEGANGIHTIAWVGRVPFLRGRPAWFLTEVRSINEKNLRATRLSWLYLRQPIDRAASCTVRMVRTCLLSSRHGN